MSVLTFKTAIILYAPYIPKYKEKIADMLRVTDKHYHTSKLQWSKALISWVDVNPATIQLWI